MGQGSSEARGGQTMLRELLRQRHLLPYRRFCRAFDIAARDVDPVLIGSYPSESTYKRWLSGRIDGTPRADACAVLEAMFPGHSAAQLLSPHIGNAPDADDSETEALELARRASASDVGEVTLAQLEQVVDDLCSSYASSQPAVVLSRTRQHLRYTGQLLAGHKTLREHRRILVAGAWLSLLAATLHIDLEQQAAATARLRTADSLASESGQDEIRAWRLETEAWRVLIRGDYRRAASLSQAAQQVAPVGSSALIQATAQEGRAWARLGDARATTGAVSRVNRMANPLAVPDRPEHHYRYDPAKAMSYTATTLSWVGDPAAVDHAREVIDRLAAADPHRGRPRRLATARIDLALALVQRGEVDEAAESTITAVSSGRVVPSNWWRVGEVVEAAEATGSRESRRLREAYEDLRDSGNGPE